MFPETPFTLKTSQPLFYTYILTALKMPPKKTVKFCNLPFINSTIIANFTCSLKYYSETLIQNCLQLTLLHRQSTTEKNKYETSFQQQQDFCMQFSHFTTLSTHQLIKCCN